MDDKLYTYLMQLPKKNLINLMWAALDEMQYYNGYTREFCICSALGLEEITDENGEITGWKPSSIYQAKKNTELMGL